MPPPRPRRRVSSKRQVSFPAATEDQSVLVVETDSDGCPEKVTRGKFARRASEMFRAGMPCKRRQTDLNCAGTQQLRSSLPSAARAAQGAENGQGWNGLLQLRRQHVQDEAHAASNSSSGNGYRFHQAWVESSRQSSMRGGHGRAFTWRRQRTGRTSSASVDIGSGRTRQRIIVSVATGTGSEAAGRPCLVAGPSQRSRRGRTGRSPCVSGAPECCTPGDL